MSESVQKRSEGKQEEEVRDFPLKAAGEIAVKETVDLEEIDKLLNDIDELFKEENAQTMVDEFVQKGGE